MWLQALASFRFRNTSKSARQTIEATSTNSDVGEVAFHIEKGQIKEAPEWVTEDWMFAAAVKDGLLREIKPVDQVAFEDASKKIPRGSPKVGADEITTRALNPPAPQPAAPAVADPKPQKP